MTETISVASWDARVRAVLIRWRWPILLAGGLLLGLTVIFPQIGLLEWVVAVPALAVLLVLASEPRFGLLRLYGLGFAFFLSYLLVTFHWLLYMYPLDFAGISRLASAGVVTVGWLGLSAFQAAGAALLLPLLAVAMRSRRLSRRPALHPLLLAALWTSLEWWWAHSGWSGVPWSRLCLGQAEILPAMQTAWLFGSYAVTFLILMVNGYLAYLLLNPHRRVLCLALAGGLFAGNLGFGAIRLATYEDGDRTITAAAIQGNKSSLDYWSLGSTSEVMDTYARLTREAVEEGAELVVWSETGIPLNIDTSGKAREFVTSLASECGVPILVGIFTLTDDGTDREYNSIVVALPDGTIHDTVYSKRNPVPFGEFVPFRSIVTVLFPPLAEINTLENDIPAGEDSVVFDLALGNVGALICFDSIYDQNARDSIENGAELLTVSTNDSWFRDSRGVWMHHAQSQYRAIETGRYIVRSANTGVSSIITATGEITDTEPPLVEGYAIETVALRTETTPYMAIGDVFAYVCILLCTLGVAGGVADAVCCFRQLRKKSH